MKMSSLFPVFLVPRNSPPYPGNSFSASRNQRHPPRNQHPAPRTPHPAPSTPQTAYYKSSSRVRCLGYLPTRVGFIVIPHYLVCEFRARNFLQHFHVIFDGINSIVSTWFACSSQERNLKRQLTWYTRQDTAPGVCHCIKYSCVAVS